MMISKALVVGAYQRKAEELAKQPGMDLLVVVPPSWKQERGYLQLSREYVKGYRLEVEPIALNGHFHVHWYPFLRRRFERFRPELVHVDEEAYNLSTLQALRLARGCNAKTVFFTWQNIDRRYPWPFSVFERYTLDHANFCIAGNQAAADIQRRRGFRGGLRVIPQFGVDTDLFRPKPALRTSGFTVGFAGRLVPQKGLWVLFDAFEQLPEDCRMLIVGSGPLGEPLRARAAQRGWSGRLTVCAASSTEMPDLYNQMDCLVLPSLTTENWKEQFGRAAIEALSCGVPVIGSDSGEIPNLLRGVGIVVPEGDAAALADAIRELHSRESLRREMGCKGRETVVGRFTQQHIARDTYRVYQEMMSEN